MYRGLVVILAFLLVPAATAGRHADRSAPQLLDLTVENGGHPFRGDSQRLVTVSPNGDGSRFGAYGIEIDARAQASPRGTKVLATIPHLYGARFTAEMTYYETAAGAKVFAAGAFTLAGDARRPVVDRLLVNLFAHLTRP